VVFQGKVINQPSGREGPLIPGLKVEKGERVELGGEEKGGGM